MKREVLNIILLYSHLINFSLYSCCGEPLRKVPKRFGFGIYDFNYVLYEYQKNE